MSWIPPRTLEVIRATLAGAVLAACSGTTHAPGERTLSDLERGRRYVEDASYRRAALEASLENPENAYSRLRLANYTEEAWGALPEWNPRARPVTDTDLGGTGTSTDGFSALDVDSVPWEEPALVELGRRAFLSYPSQLEPATRVALASAAAPEHYGLWRMGGAVGGLVWTELPKDPPAVSATCSTCHGTVENGALIAGKNDAAVDFGRMAFDAGGGEGVAWGPGRLDVTGNDGENPVAIPDLRVVHYQEHLQRAATVKNDLIALAIRTETLLITSLGGGVRPPRKVAFAIALYLWRLDAPPGAPREDAAVRGEETFFAECGQCHVPSAYSGPAVALDVVGTDPSVGESTDRGTGRYRVPTLRGVGDRTPLFATGSVRDLDELLNPSRAAKGHDYGLSLTAEARADLLAFLRTL